MGRVWRRRIAPTALVGARHLEQNINGCPVTLSWSMFDLSPVELLLSRPCIVRFGQQPALAASLVIRLGAVVDVETADEAARKGAARLLNTSLAPFIVNKGVYA